MSMTEASSEYFSQVAGSWDSLRTGYFSPAVRDAAIRKAYLHPAMVAADVGAGTGFIAAGLTPLVRRVYVVDGSEAMLDVARKNLSGFENIEYHLADGLALPFPDESLDAVFANMYLHHCPDPLAAIREMARVLVPGGRLVITDMDAHPYTWLKEEMADAWQGFEREQVRAWFSEAGLVNLVVDCTGESCCAESANPSLSDEQGREAKISVFVASGTTRVAMRDAVKSAYAAHAENSSSCCSSGSISSASASSSACCGGGSAESSSCCGGGSAAQGACCGGGAESGSCCGGSGSCTCGSNKALDETVLFDNVSYNQDYSKEELASAPQEAAEFSLGCGNPIAMSNLKPGEVVVDIGSGGGLDSFIAAGMVGPEGRVIGVDMTPAMLERARGAAQRAGITNVEFRQGFAEALPVEDSSVDVILSNCVINLTEDKGHVFREALRILKPGGRLEVSDMVLGGSIPAEARTNREGWSECVTGALPQEEYLDLVSQAGFSDVSSRRSQSGGDVLGVPVYSLIVSAKKPASS